MSKATSVKCQGLFGLGVTSCSAFVTLMNRYKSVQQAGVGFISATTTKYPSKAAVIVFESVREYFRCNRYIRPYQVVVISDVVSLLKEIRDVVPIDFDNTRSFEFNFKQVDVNLVMKALRAKEGSVETSFTGYHNLGYHIERVTETSTAGLLSALVALNSNLEFHHRERVRGALYTYFNSPGKPADAAAVLEQVLLVTQGQELDEQVQTFSVQFEKQAAAYYEALKSDQPSAVVAKKLKVDTYALSYLKKLMRAGQITEKRMVRYGHRTQATS